MPGFGNRPMPGFGGMDNKVDTSVEEPVVELPECKLLSFGKNLKKLKRYTKSTEREIM